MTRYLAIVRHQLSSLTRFSGRDSPGQFWIWVATVMGLYTIASFIVLVPVTVDAVSRIDRFARENPDLATRTIGPGSYSVEIGGSHPELMPDIGPLMLVSGIAAAIALLLLAASTVRRLHDTDRRGWWGVLPVPFLAVGVVGFSALQPTWLTEPDFALFAMLFLNNVIYLAMVALLIYLTVRRGTAGPNRFGPPPG